MEKSIDILFIHTPKFNDHYPPLGDFTFINVMPSGLFALADYLEKRGVVSRIVHNGVRYAMEGQFDPLHYVGKYDPSIVALTLHWHHQSYDVIESARRIRAVFPDKAIVLGGLTASYFADEIIREYPFIDAVFQGDSEEPLRLFTKLLKNYDSYKKIPLNRLNEIPNIIFRYDGALCKSGVHYYTSKKTFDGFDYFRTELMDDGDFYVENVGIPSFWIKGKDADFHNRNFDRFTKVYFPVTGRGCPMSCPWCGRERRVSVMWRDPLVVADSIEQAVKRGWEELYFTFEPGKDSADYYVKLFEILKGRGLDLPVYYESWSLPERKLIDAVGGAFSDAVIALSPESGSRKVRKKCRGLDYSNDDLLEIIKYMADRGVDADLFFACGLPGENEEIFGETVRLIERVEEGFPSVQAVSLFGIEMEPGSPWFEDPEKWGIVTERRSFSDFYNTHGPRGRGSFSSLGYRVPGYFGDEGADFTTSDFETRIEALRNRTKPFEGIIQL